MTHSILFNQKDVTIKQNPEQRGKVKISLLITIAKGKQSKEIIDSFKQHRCFHLIMFFFEFVLQLL